MLTLPRPLVLAGLAAALAAPAAAQHAGRDPAAGTPSPGGVTLIDREHPVDGAGELRIWRAWASQEARVMLKVFRREGSRLVLVGASPLEVVPAGQLAVFSCRIPVVRGDLVGVSCPDAACVDRFADGDALVGTGDVGTTEEAALTAEVGTPAVDAWGGEGLDVPSPVDTELVVPVVARTPGFEGTQWVTDLVLANPGGQEAQVALVLDASDADNTVPAATATVTVPAGGVLELDSLLRDTFGLDPAAGALEILADRPVAAWARIANLGGGGTYGQTVPAVPAAWALGGAVPPGADPASRTAFFAGLHEDGAWRSNLGAVNLSPGPIQLVVAAHTAAGTIGSPLTLELPPHSHTQVNRVLDALGVPRGTPGVTVTVALAPGVSGRFLAYASRVDNTTGDAVFLLGTSVPAL